MKIVSWNVNGIRAALRKGFLDYLSKESPDILGIQEIKGKPHQFPPELRHTPGYHVYFNPAERPGYSGVALYSRQEPMNVSFGFGVDKFDIEGRVITAEYRDFYFLTIYFPNGRRDHSRVPYKLEFYDVLLRFCRDLEKKGKPIIVSGDYNTAHTEIDLARPKENMNTTGFLPEERDYLEKWFQAGYIDTFREFHDQGDEYTWWSMQSRARERNVGWRIDYHLISSHFRDSLKNAYIRQDILGSDHAPVYIEIA